MVTETTVPAAPAPGETTATAAAGLVAVAAPVSDTLSGDPPGAESATTSDPVRAVGVVLLGVKFTIRLQVELAAMTPFEQALLAAKSPVGVSVKVSDCDSWLVSVRLLGALTVPTS